MLLMEPPKEENLSAFLLCDGLNWRLIGHFNLKSLTPPLLKLEKVALKSLPSTSSSAVAKKKPRNKLPEVILEEYSLSGEYDSTELNSSSENATLEQPVP
jgi:hypothetical protein